uniref:Leucine-rich repeat, immunoglobulin-like domain and transmembrane domain-containing protein 3 n=1 Tax=Catagonus wagneri TaxID=51154 RepID=A0A8C3WAH4_9CETA
MHLFASLCIALSFLERVSCSCPSQCTCDYHGRNDGMRSRWVLCNDQDMNEIPTNFPVDTVKLRVEKTVVHRVPAEAFYYLVELQYLWLTYNSVASLDTSSFYNLKQLHELRLDGNSLAAFPWTSLRDMPRLRTLDLHNNRITSVPNEAIRYLKKLAYLDLSSNRLTTLPPDFLESWSHLVTSGSLDLLPRIILGLQDNPWFCDCHISKIMALSKVADPTVVLLDPLMICSEPERLTGILFQRAELEQCLKPSVMTSATQITSALGSNVLLRCDATGYPTPQLTWTRPDSSPVNYTVIQESPGEGVRWSIISLTGISHMDAGDYKCKAKNLAGMSEAVVTVTVVGVVTTTMSSDTSERRSGDHPEQEVQPGSRRSALLPGSSPSPWLYSSSSSSSASSTFLPTSTLPPPSAASFSLSPFFSTVSSATAPSTRISTSTTMASPRRQSPRPDGKRNVKMQMGGSRLPPASATQREELALLDRGLTMEMNATIENLQVVSETDKSVILTWNTINTTQNLEVTVLYSRYGEKDLLLLNADPSKNQVTINGLLPGRQYIACVCPKGMPPRKDQCITFSTDRVEEGDSEVSLLMVVSGAACVIVMPLIFFLLYKVCKLQCQSESFWEDDLMKETYIPFETLSPRSQSVGELWTRSHRNDSEKLLLCSRSGVESTFKSEGPEYYC